MGSLDAMLDANARYAEDFDKGDAQLPPNRPVAVVTCIDARLHPERFLGVDIGDIHVIRNAGGAPAMTRSVLSSSPHSCSALAS